MAFLALLASCDSDSDDILQVEENDSTGKFISISMTDLVIQDFELEIYGKVEGDISKVKMLVDNKPVRTVNVADNYFQISYEFASYGDLEVQFQGINSNSVILSDTIKKIPVLKKKAQAIDKNDKSNKLGLWIWYLKETGFESHKEISDKTSEMGVKRVFVKVADGRSLWPEADDKCELTKESFLNYYHKNNMEVFAWSYNYPAHEDEQSEALYHAAKAGYDGFVLDLEVEFDGKSTELESMMQAFYKQMMKAIKDGYIDESFPLIVTTWGNPKDHNMRVDIIDKYVDAHMPQTYIEKWGGTWLSNPENTIDVGNAEYKSMGAKKPVCHIFSAENVGSTAIDPELLSRAMKYGGGQSSIWKIPGSNMGGNWKNNWSIIEQIDWKYDYSTN